MTPSLGIEPGPHWWRRVLSALRQYNNISRNLHHMTRLKNRWAPPGQRSAVRRNSRPPCFLYLRFRGLKKLTSARSCSNTLLRRIYTGLFLKRRCKGRFTPYDLSARRRRSANLACILTADERPIRGNEHRSDSKNLLQCNRFFEVGQTLERNCRVNQRVCEWVKN